MAGNVVFTSEGPDSRAMSWQGGDYELVLVDYRVSPGTKWQNFCRFFVGNADYVLCLDDDLSIDAPALDALFALARERDLWLAQPAFTLDSQVSWWITLQHPFLELRYTNFVENGAVLFSRYALEIVRPTLEVAVTGFGLDQVWSSLLGDPVDRIAIVDSVACRHPNRKSALDAVVPRAEHAVEGELLRRQFGVADFTPKVYSAVLNRNGAALGKGPEDVLGEAQRYVLWQKRMLK